MEDLFEVKNAFHLGNYQGAINAGTSVAPSTAAGQLERDVYVYLSYVAQGNATLPLTEITEPEAAPTALRGVYVLAQYFGGERDLALATLEHMWADGHSSKNPTLCVIAADVWAAEGETERALRAVHDATDLEGMAKMVELLLSISRPAEAERVIARMHAVDDDATLTQLATVWLCLFQGGTRVQEANHIIQDLCDKYSSTISLLNTLGICHVHLSQLEEAEQAFKEALEKDSKHVDTLINLSAVYAHCGKQRLSSRFLTQIQSVGATHQWSRSVADASAAFDHHAAQYAPSK